MTAHRFEDPQLEALVAAIMATPHTLAMTKGDGTLEPWVMRESHVRDLVAHGKGDLALRRCLLWDPEGCPTCGRDVDRQGGNEACQDCAGEPPAPWRPA